VTTSVVPADDPTAAGLIREYCTEVAARYLGHPPDAAVVDTMLGGDLLGVVVARSGGVPAGCAGLRRLAPGVGELKRLYVRPAARRRGVGIRLLDAVAALARSHGLHTLRLDTRTDLTEARALYARYGFTEIARYNDDPYAGHWFELRLDQSP
jgi:ribosomal protein S18 acetylase RimI-like enzyme